ncbi:MAG: hypothetical protein ACW99U_20310 [Candidatus Thorarchaeota archaeon]|jgi:hypothetical protein
MNWRPIFINSTGADADSDGIVYLDIPNDREYKIVSLKMTYERSSDITYGAAQAPLMDIVTSTSAHGSSAAELLLARYRSPATMTADTVANVVFFQQEIPAGDTFAGVAIDTQNFYVKIPSDLILSTEMRIKMWTTASTGGVYAIQDIEGLACVRGQGGHKA